MATVVNVQDPSTLNNLAVNSSGQIGVSNFPGVQTVQGTVNVAFFPANQVVSGSVDVTDRSTRQLGIVTVASGTIGTNTAPAYNIIQDGTTNANRLKVNSDGSINITGSTTSSNPSVGTDGSAIPTSSTLIGGSDGTNLQQLLVESASNRNLRVALYNGANEAGVTSGGSLHVTVDNGNANGQTTTTNSSPVVIASNQTKIPVTGDFTEQASLSAGSLNADLVPATDVSGYKWLSLQIEGAYSGIISFQWSNDNITYHPLVLNRFDTATAANSGNATSGTGSGWCGPVTFRWLRVRMTSYTSGTANGTLELYTVPPPFILDGVNSIQSGTWTAVPNAATTGGSTASHTISTASTNATSVKGSAGQVYGISLSNSNAAVRYVKFYNKATAPTVGTDIPILTLAVPANGTRDRSFPVGLTFATGIAFATTTGIADTDTGTVGASDLSIDFDYK